MAGESVDRAFEALANPHRRQLLFALVTANPQADDGLDPLNLLAEEASEGPSVSRAGLRHVHLPKLADMGFVEWDRDAGDVSKGPDWDELAPVLQALSDSGDERSERWLPDLTDDEETPSGS